jgi:AraC-like DNA-binding protein
MYVDYQRAFIQGTGLPLALQEPDRVHLVRHGRRSNTPLCLVMARTNKACAACYAMQQQLERAARLKTRTLRCFAGLCESAVPVRVGEKLIAFLHTGRILLRPPTRAGFNRIAATLLSWGAEVDFKALEEAYFQTRVLSRNQYQGLLRLLEGFASHLAACGNELLLRTPAKEPAVVARARAFMTAHYAEELKQALVARAVGCSATYFSKHFKQVTGMSFIDYLGRVRVQRAKSFLQNPSLRVGSIAFEVGFRSVSQFNRTFKKMMGRSPKTFRSGSEPAGLRFAKTSPDHELSRTGTG